MVHARVHVEKDVNQHATISVIMLAKVLVKVLVEAAVPLLVRADELFYSGEFFLPNISLLLK